MYKGKKYLPYVSAVASSTIFGFSFLFSKKALNVAAPFSLLSFRFLVAFLLMSLLILFGVVKVNYKNKPLKDLFILSLMQPVIYFIFEAYGLKYSPSSVAGIMISLIPVIVTILASYFLKEKASPLQWAFIILSVCGVGFIVIMDNSSNGNGNMLGIVLLIITVMSAAIFNILSRKHSLSFTPIEMTYFMMGLAAVVFNGISIIGHIISGNILSYFAPLKNTDFIISIIYLGIISSVIAFALVNYTLSKIEASKSAVFSNLSTIVSIAAGVIILHEEFKFYHLIGSIMILIGVWGTSYLGAKKPSKIEDSSSLNYE